MKTSLVGLFFFFLGCSNAPTKNITPTALSLTENPLSVDVANIEKTADISSRIKWCGLDYEPFYLTSMQFERLRERPQMDFAWLGYYHGAKLEKQFKALSLSNCTREDLKKVRDESEKQLAVWCKHSQKRKELNSRCEGAANIFEK